LDRQRIDKWLWHARIVRTRVAAAELADRGHVRINGSRITAASRKVTAGDVITIALGRVRILKVLEFAERRGAADSAAGLYEDLQPAQAAIPASGPEAGSGRPEKREWRAIDKMRGRYNI
jgi:ribosome-associated heat shock protein Hsp15